MEQAIAALGPFVSEWRLRLNLRIWLSLLTQFASTHPAEVLRHGLMRIDQTVREQIDGAR